MHDEASEIQTDLRPDPATLPFYCILILQEKSEILSS